MAAERHGGQASWLIWAQPELVTPEQRQWATRLRQRRDKEKWQCQLRRTLVLALGCKRLLPRVGILPRCSAQFRSCMTEVRNA